MSRKLVVSHATLCHNSFACVRHVGRPTRISETLHHLRAYRRPIYTENMSEIEYSDLLFQISTKIDVNQLDRLVFMCRKLISEGSEGTIQNALGLFKELEKQDNLGMDRLENLKQILKQLKNRPMLKKVEEFEIKRKGAQSMLVIFVLKFSKGNLKSRKCLFAREVQFKT